MLEGISERLQSFNSETIVDYEKSWDKFLTFVVNQLLNRKLTKAGPPTQIIISPATVIDRTSSTP